VKVVLIEVDIVAPNRAELRPATDPSIHMSVPLVLTELRGLPPLIASVSAVVVSTAPLESTRAMTRLMIADVELVMFAVPGSAS
jgi:hypothetical protein